MIDPIELHGLADGELSADKEAEVKKLLAACSASQAELQSIVGLKTFLREKTPAVECSQAWKGCVGRLNEIDRTRKIERLVSVRFGWGLCSVLFATILFTGYIQRGNHDPNQTSAELARMVASLGPSRSAEASSHKELDAKLDALLKQARVSIDPGRMTIMSRAYGELDGQSVMRITLRDANGDLALVVVPSVLKLDGLGEMPQDHQFKMGHLLDKNCVAWTDGQNTLVLVANRSYEDLAATAMRITFH